MSEFTQAGRQLVADTARRHGLSEAAVEMMARAVAQGSGTMAQFNIQELGGSGQWMAGGMTMVGNMFDTGLQARVSNLCSELSNAMAGMTVFTPPASSSAGNAMGCAGNWWPPELGQPSSVGGQNQARYAYFPQARRIAFDPGQGTAPILLDTGDHNIGGFSQQQSGPGDPFLGVSFSSQFGQFSLSSLPRVQETMTTVDEAASPAEPHADDDVAPAEIPKAPAIAEPAQDEAPTAPMVETARVQPREAKTGIGAGDIIATIERLAALHQAGVLTDTEFADKKTELLARI